jgi:putative peptide modification system cyclase
VNDSRIENEHSVIREAPAAAAPRVHTLLLCDLVDSTALVERLGDAAAAELFRKHDRIAREALQRHRGREIDKTDGFLVLFERPLHAVGFALDYQRALNELGSGGAKPLAARVGIHVGEVVLWENASADIAAGAKPVEVEGLAKSVAARLMQLAVPGQTLLSGIAFSLAQRAASELRDAANLRWLTHGRYRFKGVAAPMLVHEVGEAGFAPLQAPPSTAKAQRDVPLWRRPGALALEAIALLAAVAIPFALSLRAAPAIAFGERDWIVMAELNNLTGETLLDDSLETAFRISLEQSRYVNVLSDLKLRDTLARMQKPADTAVDRNIASEIALREGARAVILPTVAEIGGRVRVSAEVIDPHTQTTVYAESADGVGAASTLDSIDSVTHTLREKLGETLASIEKDSAPLPQVTSKNLDALRAYALGERAYAQDRLDEADALFGEAAKLDAEFALAMIGKARVAYRRDRFRAAHEHAQHALALKDRLTARDALYVDAWAAYFGAPEATIEKWNVLTTLYPDHLDARYNLGLFQALLANRFEDCLTSATRIDIAQYASRADAVYLKAFCSMGLNRIEEASREFERARTLGTLGVGTAHAAAYAVQREFDAAMQRLQQDATASIMAIERPGLLAAIAADRGDLAAAKLHLEAAVDAGAEGSNVSKVWSTQAQLLAAADGLVSDEPGRLESLLKRRIAALPGDPPEHTRPEAFAVLALGLVAARSGQPELADRALAAIDSVSSLEGYPLHQALRNCLRAERLSDQGDYAAALALLPDSPDQDELLQQHASRLRVLRASGRNKEALAQARALAVRRGRAYSEIGQISLLVPLNIVEVNLAALTTAELLAVLETADAARQALGEFSSIWPEAVWPESIKRRVESLGGEQVP